MDHMMENMNTAMGGMGAVCVVGGALLLVLIVLGIAALLKYLLSGRK
jgi:hypothetical protein